MKTPLLFAATLLSLSATVHADTDFTPRIHSLLVDVCEHTQDDNRFSLNKALRQNHLSRPAAVAKVVCNGQQLLDFARSSNAHKVVAMLTPYERRAKVSISDVAAP